MKTNGFSFAIIEVVSFFRDAFSFAPSRNSPGTKKNREFHNHEKPSQTVKRFIFFHFFFRKRLKQMGGTLKEVQRNVGNHDKHVSGSFPSVYFLGNKL